MAIEIRLLHDNENELANNFFNEIYKTHRPFENFVWEFRSGPKGKAIYVVAVDNAEINFTKIVGIQCAIPLDFISPDGKIVLTAKSEDTLVDPAYRGQKLFERMYDLLFAECKKAGIKYIWGFTPALKAFERIGFKAPFKTSQALLVFKPLQAYQYLKKLNSSNSFLDKLKIFGLCLLSYLKGFKRVFVSGTKLAVSEVTFSSKDTLLKTLYQSLPQYYFIRQNEAYLDWRLTKNPFNNQYRNFQVSNGSTLVADIIVNWRSDVAYVEQVLFSSQVGSEQRLSILKNIVSVAGNDTSLIRTLCFETNNEMLEQVTLLKTVGFTYLNRGNYFVWKSLDAEETLSPENLFLSRLFTQGNL
jgi:GNAT superfamily N-acetyltransferase